MVKVKSMMTKAKRIMKRTTNNIAVCYILFVLTLSGCGKHHNPQPCDEIIPVRDGRPTILVIGDSISIGYTPYLVTALPHYQVIHNPCNAQSSEYTVEHINEWLRQRHDYASIVYNNGLWDIATFINTPYYAYQENERYISQRIQAKTNSPLFLTTTAVPSGTPYRSDGKVVAFNDLIAPIIQSMGVPVLDLYNLSIRRPISSEHAGPGDVHYNAQGSKNLANAVLHALNHFYGIK